MSKTNRDREEYRNNDIQNIIAKLFYRIGN